MIVTMGMGTEQGGGTNLFYLEEEVDIAISTEIDVAVDFDRNLVIVTEED